MKTIFNFGHPLSEKAKEQLTEQFGPDHLVVHIPIQIDQSQPVKKQIYDLCHEARQASGQPDYIILPGLAIAAVFVDRYFSRPEDDYPPCVTYKPIVRLVMGPGTRPPVFVVAGVE